MRKDIEDINRKVNLLDSYIKDIERIKQKYLGKADDAFDRYLAMLENTKTNSHVLRHSTESLLYSRGFNILCGYDSGDRLIRSWILSENYHDLAVSMIKHYIKTDKYGAEIGIMDKDDFNEYSAKPYTGQRYYGNTRHIRKIEDTLAKCDPVYAECWNDLTKALISSGLAGGDRNIKERFASPYMQEAQPASDATEVILEAEQKLYGIFKDEATAQIHELTPSETYNPKVWTEWYQRRRFGDKTAPEVVEVNVFSELNDYEPTPGAICVIDPDGEIALVDSDGVKHNPPAVLILNEPDDNDLVLVAQLHSCEACISKIDTRIKDRLWAESYNIYGMKRSWLKRVGDKIDPELAQYILSLQGREISRSTAFMKQEIEVGTYFSLPAVLSSMD